MAGHSSTVESAVTALARGEVIAVPTETVYGLACDARDPEAVERLFQLKGRPEHVPLPVALADSSAAVQWQSGPDPRLEMLASRWWPGPLTVVVPASADVPHRVTAGLGTVALRVPDQAHCKAVLDGFGRAVVLTSANRHGQPPARSMRGVLDTFPEGLGAVIDGGPSVIGTPSTLVALLRGGAWRVLREGAVSAEELAAVLGA